MFSTGLVSITFRQLSCPQIIELVRQAGLDAIEWGGDVHVPHGNLAQAAQTRRQTQDAGLQVASYGSYYRVGHDDVAFEPVLATAIELGAPIIRVWAGKLGSEVADEAYYKRIMDDTLTIADMTKPYGIRISFEFHGNTLLDRNESAVRFLDELAHPNVSTYWQPPVYTSVEYRLAGLRGVLPYLTHLHVFEWDKRDLTWHPLSDGADEWMQYLTTVAAFGGDHHLLLEFVAGNQPEQFLADARTLQQLIRQTQNTQPSLDVAP